MGDGNNPNVNIKFVAGALAIILLAVGAVKFFSFDGAGIASSENIEGVWKIDFERSVAESPTASAGWLTTLAKNVDHYEYVVVGETITFKKNGKVRVVCPMKFLLIDNEAGESVESRVRYANCSESERWFVFNDYGAIKLGFGLGGPYYVLTRM